MEKWKLLFTLHYENKAYSFQRKTDYKNKNNSLRMYIFQTWNKQHPKASCTYLPRFFINLNKYVQRKFTVGFHIQP